MSDQEQQNQAPDPMAKLAEYARRANPDAIPELIRGSSIEEIEASIEPAREAYKRVADSVRPADTAAAAAAGAAAGAAAAAANPQTVIVTAPQVPAGGASNPVDLSKLSETELIRRGLEQRKKSPRT